MTEWVDPYEKTLGEFDLDKWMFHAREYIEYKNNAHKTKIYELLEKTKNNNTEYSFWNQNCTTSFYGIHKIKTKNRKITYIDYYTALIYNTPEFIEKCYMFGYTGRMFNNIFDWIDAASKMRPNSIILDNIIHDRSPLLDQCNVSDEEKNADQTEIRVKSMAEFLEQYENILPPFDLDEWAHHARECCEYMNKQNGFSSNPVETKLITRGHAWSSMCLHQTPTFDDHEIIVYYVTDFKKNIFPFAGIESVATKHDKIIKINYVYSEYSIIDDMLGPMSSFNDKYLWPIYGRFFNVMDWFSAASKITDISNIANETKILIESGVDSENAILIKLKWG